MSPIVDAHVHLFGPGDVPEAWHDATAWRWSERTFPPRDPGIIRPRIDAGLHDSDGEILRGEMDRLGIHASVALGLDWGWSLGEAKTSVEETHKRFAMLQSGELGNLQGRFFAVAGVDPRRPGALEFFEHCVTDYAMRGLKLYPPTGFWPYDDVCMPFYEKCLELGVPLVVHTAVVGYPMRTRFAHPHAMSDVQCAFPELTIVLAHAGHDEWGAAARAVAARHPKTYLEISNWNHGIASDPDGTARALVAMRDAVGAHRVLFGSDHFGGPRFSGDTSAPALWLQFLQEMPERAKRVGSTFSEEEVTLILGQNAVRVFNLRLQG